MDEELLIELLNDADPEWRANYLSIEHAQEELDIWLDTADDPDFRELNFD